MIFLVKIHNYNRLTEQLVPAPEPIVPIAKPVKQISKEQISTNRPRIKQLEETAEKESKNFIKSTIWPEYLHYLSTGERINQPDAFNAWTLDSHKYKSEFSIPSAGFSVVSWNVKCFYGAEKILETLKTLDVDVLCFQEYSPHHLPEIDKWLERYPYRQIALIPLTSGVGETRSFGNAIFSKHEFTDVQVKELRNIDDLDDESGGYTNEKRLAISVKIADLQIITTHLTVGDGDTDNLRLMEVQTLLSMIDSGNCIICGDFNSGIDNNEKVHEIMTGGLRHMYSLGKRMYSSTSIYGGTVDHFYYKFSDMRMLDVQIIFSDASDHYPLLANIIKIE
jgi:endonuclease/exonuclease/phosphatase family metal-dependent hydrolase